MRPFISHCQATSPGLAFDAEVGLKTPLASAAGSPVQDHKEPMMSFLGVAGPKKRKKQNRKQTKQKGIPPQTLNCQLCTTIKGKRHKGTATGPLI